MTTLATSRITGRPVAANSALAVVSAAAPNLQVMPRASEPAPTPGLMDSIILPSVRDRWMGATKKQYTPTYVETVLRSAASGNLTGQWQMFDLMEETWPRLSKNLNQLKDAVVDLDRQFQPWAPKGKKPSAEAIRRAGIIEEILCKMQPDIAGDENDLDDTIRDILDATGKGISVLETDYAPVEISTGLAMGARATRHIHPRYYGYPSHSGAPDRLMLNVREIEQSAPGVSPGSAAVSTLTRQDAGGTLFGEFADFPAHKFIIAIRKTKSGHPLGGALLRLLGTWWAASNFTTEWFINYAQIFGTPFRWANYDPAMTPADRAKLLQMLAFMGSAGYGMFPAGTVLEFKEAVKNAGDNAHKVLLDFADKQCDILLLRQTLTTEVGDSGSQALGTVHQGVLGDVVSGLANFTAKTINRQLIEPLCLFNFGDLKECPWLSLMPADNEDPKAKAERFKVLIDSGARIPEQWFAEQNGIPVAQAGEAVIERAAPQSAPGVPPGSAPGDQTQQDEAQARGTQRDAGGTLLAQAKDAATVQLVDRGLEELTGVQARWLGGVRPIFLGLVAKAKDARLSDDDFIQALAAAQKNLPELFLKLDTRALADWFNGGLGAAAVNGAVRGALERGVRNAERGTAGSQPLGGAA